MGTLVEFGNNNLFKGVTNSNSSNGGWIPLERLSMHGSGSTRLTGATVKVRYYAHSPMLSQGWAFRPAWARIKVVVPWGVATPRPAL